MSIHKQYSFRIPCLSIVANYKTKKKQIIKNKMKFSYIHSDITIFFSVYRNTLSVI